MADRIEMGRDLKEGALLSGADKRAFFAIMLGLFLSVIDSSAVNLAVPLIAREFEVASTNAIMVVNAYQIAVLVMLLPLAAVGARLGYRTVFLSGIALYAASSLLACVSGSFETLIAARAIQGVGAAGVMSVNVALLRIVLPKALLGRGLAMHSVLVAIAVIAGPLLSAAILSFSSWPWLFALNIPLGLMALWCGLRTLPGNESATANGASRKFMLASVILNAATFSLLFLGAASLLASRGQSWSESASGWIALVLGLMVGGFYLKHQSLRPQPLFPVDLMRTKEFSWPLYASISSYCALTIAHVALPFLLLGILGYTPFESALFLAGWPVAIMLAAPVAGKLIGRYSPSLLAALGMLIFAMGLGWMAALTSNASSAELFSCVLLCGAGFGLFQSPNAHSLITSTPLSRSGAGSAMTSTARLFGQTLGATILAALYAFLPGTDGSAETVGLLAACGFALMAGAFSGFRHRAKLPGFTA